MDRGAWRVTVRGVANGRKDSNMTKQLTQPDNYLWSFRKENVSLGNICWAGGQKAGAENAHTTNTHTTVSPQGNV